MKNSKEAKVTVVVKNAKVKMADKKYERNKKK